MAQHLKSFLEHLEYLNKTMNSIACEAIFYCLDPANKSAIMVGKDAARITRQLSQSVTSKVKVSGYIKLRDKHGRRVKTGYVIKIE